MNIILYGPPGVGKTTVGRALAEKMGREFIDSDPLIENLAGRSIPHIFSQLGEAEFRRLETKVCAELAARRGAVIALGGGALMNPGNRAAMEGSGIVICLRAGAEELLARVAQSVGQVSNLPYRPLLAGDDQAKKLGVLLKSRRALYDSFSIQVDTSGKSAQEVADEVEALFASRRLTVNAPGLSHDILLGYGLLENLADVLAVNGLTGPAVVVTDENIRLNLKSQNPKIPNIVLPAGEEQKTLGTIGRLYDEFLKCGVDRAGIVIAVGGGVIGDMAGFAAATFMRGVRWVNAPTTLLAMVDASLGGKTGVDLPQGKNLVGAFHPPSLVISDPLALRTLPQAERVSGMAEVIKHGVIGDVGLFEWIEGAPKPGDFGLRLDWLQRAIEVKVRVVEADPFEKGERAILNVGHTIGHGVEAASKFKLRHGESVAIGMAAESRLAERLGLAESGLAERIERVCIKVGLPVNCSGLNPSRIREAMSSDKKKAGGVLKFALPKRIGEAVWGVEVEEEVLRETLEAITA